MALAPLAAPADLPSKWETHVDAPRALDIASSLIRAAAENVISRTIATVTVTGDDSRTLDLPRPVTAVTAVTVDGALATNYKTLAEGLWRADGWGAGGAPSVVEVTATFGLLEVPDDIVDLCAQLAIAWLEHEADGGGSVAGLRNVSIDDGRESYTDEAAGSISPVFIPEKTREWLRARFNPTGVVVLGTL